jgi:hypothetical protein
VLCPADLDFLAGHKISVAVAFCECANARGFRAQAPGLSRPVLEAKNPAVI